MVDMAPAGEAIACQLISLRRVIDQLELQFSQLAAEFDQTDWWDYEGFNSSGDWIRFNCRMTSNAAYDRLAVGERLADLPRSTDAMESGEIGFAHLAVMARTADAVGKGFEEAKLLPLAREHSPGKFHYKCLHYRHSVDAKKYAEEQNEQQFSHHLSLSTAESGHLLINGVLDPVGGAAVRTVLEPLARNLLGSPRRGCAGEPTTSAAPALRRRPGRAGLGRQAGQHPGHGHDRDLEGPGRCRRRGDGVLASHLLGRGPAHGLRLQRDPRPAQPGVARHGCGASQAHRLVVLEAGAESSRRPLPLARVRTDGVKVRRASRRALDQRRSDRARQPGPALSPAPSHGA